MNEIKLTPEERLKYDTIRSCLGGDITNKEASSRLGLVVRQIQKLKRAVEEFEEAGVVHKLKGVSPANTVSKNTIRKVLEFFDNDKHKDFGPTFAQEKLEASGVLINKETLRLLMIKKKIWQVKPRRGPQIIREWRERKECFGELVQFDGSYHDWLETGDEECLLAAIDDATGQIVHAVFEDNEGVQSVFRFWWAYIEAYGLPVAIYLDKFCTYKVNNKHAVDNVEFITQFERAMRDLGIEVICANSPEAKGRVERLFGTLQDRLIKEMRLVDIKTRAGANKFIGKKYICDHNRRFSVVAKNKTDAHRPVSDILRKRLPAIFSVQSKRKVNNDYTIQFKTFWYQLNATQKTTVYKRDEVIVEEHLDGTTHIRHKDIYLEYRVLPERPKPVKVPLIALTRQKIIWKPPANHPWRKMI